MDEAVRRDREPNGLTGDVVSPPDLGSLAVVAHLCHQNEIPISLTSGAPSTHQNAPNGGVVISVHRLNDVVVAAPGLTVRAGAGATVEQLRDAVSAEEARGGRARRRDRVRRTSAH